MNIYELFFHFNEELIQWSVSMNFSFSLALTCILIVASLNYLKAPKLKFRFDC